MTQERESSRALMRRMGEMSVPADLASDPARPYRVAAVIDAQLEQLAHRKRVTSRWRKVALVSLLAAAFPLGLFAMNRERWQSATEPTAQATIEAVQGDVAVARAGRLTNAHDVPQRLLASDELRTAAGGRAQARLQSGATASLAEDSVLVLSESRPGQEILALRQGSIDVSVPQLPVGNVLGIRTHDALVRVHGTRFSVAVEEVAGTMVTRVAVREGTVSIEHGLKVVVLTAGGTWSSLAPPQVPSAPAAVAMSAASPLSTPSAGAASSGRADEKSTLAQENSLYLRAMTHAKSGDDRRALDDLELLVSQYPGSPLRSSAQVEQFRALNRLGRQAEAARVARRYLTSHPSGSAAAEARALVERTP